MSEDEFEDEAQYLSDLVTWLLQADQKKRRLDFLRYIKRQAEYIEERMADA